MRWLKRLSPCGRDVELRALEAIHRFHRYIFDDDEWGCEEYLDLYVPIVLFIAYCVIICLIAAFIGNIVY